MKIIIVKRFKPEICEPDTAYLSERELEIMKEIAKGADNKTTARKLFLSPKSLDHQAAIIVEELHVSHRWCAVRLLLLNGNLTLDDLRSDNGQRETDRQTSLPSNS